MDDNEAGKRPLAARFSLRGSRVALTVLTLMSFCCVFGSIGVTVNPALCSPVHDADVSVIGGSVLDCAVRSQDEYIDEIRDEVKARRNKIRQEQKVLEKHERSDIEASDEYVSDSAESGDVDGTDEESLTLVDDVSEDEVSESSHEFWFDAIPYEDLAAMDAGYMIEYVPSWYCVHWYTDYGSQIHEMQPGDIVHVNGRTVEIAGSFDVPRDGYVEDVRAEYDESHVLFQTCYYAGSPYMLVKYGFEI